MSENVFGQGQTKQLKNIDISRKPQMPEKEISNMMIYNTANYQTQASLQIIIFDRGDNNVVVDKVITPDKCIIWKYQDEYGLLDIYSATNDISDDIQEIKNSCSSYEDTVGYARLYPDFNDKDCYIKMRLPLVSQIISSVTNFTTSRKILSQMLIDNKIDVLCDGETINSIKLPFENIVRQNVDLEPEEEVFVRRLYELQQDDNYFNKSHEKTKKKKSIIPRKVLTPKKPKTEAGQTEVKTSSDEVFDPSVLKIIEGSNNPMEDMANIIGLDNIKHEIEKLKYTLEYKKERSNRGIRDESVSSMHMCFYGSPGTGKTMIARIMTGLLYEMGYIKENKCVEINGLEFKGGYVGQTEIITKGILDYSKGGVLFVDEAYALCSNSNDTYGQEAVNTFIKEMEDNRDELVIIFAGYEGVMETFLNMNSGFRSRINRYFKFEDYTLEQLDEILMNKLNQKHLYIDLEALAKCTIILKKAKKFNEFGNGRFVGNLIEKIEEDHIMNVEHEESELRVDTLKIEDIKDKVVEGLINNIK